MSQRLLPIGIDDFKEIRQRNCYYIDKTGLIRDLLNNPSKVTLFTRPRRFGKTLNMSMLRHFFGIGADPALFEGLAIAQETVLCEQYLGKYPVIFISLKDVEGLNFASAQKRLIRKIGTEAERFAFILDGDQLSANEKEKYRSLIAMEEGSYSMTEDMLSASLALLSALLSKYYGQKTILLIDEYDVPLDKAFLHGYYDEMAALLRGLFSQALKTNEFLEFAVLTGCLRVSKESIFTGLNNFRVLSITDVRFDEHFGFTEAEVRRLLVDYELEGKEKLIREWYDGYRFGNANIYCPWDVISYAALLRADADAEPEAFWINTSGNDLVKRFIDKADKTTQEEIERLIAGEAIEKAIRLDLTYDELDSSIANLWSVLFTTGYLTQAGKAARGVYQLVIPNKEIREIFISQIQEWFSRVVQSDPSRIQRFCAAFPSGDVETIEEMLNNYLWDSISIRDTAVRKNQKENFYHGLLLGLLRSEGKWLIRSNAEAGEGYSDITICTPERIGIIIELKYAEDGDLEKACGRALQQIEDKRYTEAFRGQRMKKIFCCGMAFYEKDCVVRMAEMQREWRT